MTAHHQHRAKTLPSDRHAPAWLFERYFRPSLLIGVFALIVLLLVTLLGAKATAQHAGALDYAMRGWLSGFLLWTGASLGCMALLMVNHLSAGKWGLVIRRILEAGSRTFPLMCVLGLPIVFYAHHLYPWTPENIGKLGEEAQQIVRHKQVMLNLPFFYVRYFLYFVIWSAFSFTLSRWSILRDEDPVRRDWTRIMENLSGIGLVVYSLTMTFAVVDWVMSLDATWFSTIYGLIYLAGQGLTALSISIITLLLLGREEPLRTILRKTELHDLGKLMLAFVMLYAYLSFSQWLIIWSGNLTEEIPWYLNRINGGWLWVSRFLVVFEFAVPFALLLSRTLKRRPGFMVPLCVGIIAVRVVDLYWMIEPNFRESQGFLHFHIAYLLAPIAIGGLWIATFIHTLKSRPVIPAYDPQLAEILEPEHAAV
ncbi:MAG TPA: hypothetical protein VFZ99_00255 [Terriglobales bacterium]